MALPLPMDENETALVRLLYTRIGIIMEESSVTALELGGPRSKLDPANLRRLKASTHKLVALAYAAKALRE